MNGDQRLEVLRLAAMNTLPYVLPLDSPLLKTCIDLTQHGYIKGRNTWHDGKPTGYQIEEMLPKGWDLKIELEERLEARRQAMKAKTLPAKARRFSSEVAKAVIIAILTTLVTVPLTFFLTKHFLEKKTDTTKPTATLEATEETSPIDKE